MGNIIFFHTKEDKPMLDVLTVARYFLSLGAMKHKKLQKLCYYAQAWHLAFTGSRLVDNDFEAWIHGPVSPKLFDRYKDWGGLTIPQIKYDGVGIPEYIQQFLNHIYEMYKEYTADDLENLTHQEKPWIEAREGYSPNEICRVKIDDETIKDFYGNYYRSLNTNGQSGNAID